MAVANTTVRLGEELWAEYQATLETEFCGSRMQ